MQTHTREIIPNEKQDCKFKYEWRGICVGGSREKRKYFNLKNKLKINFRKARQRRKKKRIIEWSRVKN